VALPAVAVIVAVSGTLIRRARAAAHPIAESIGGIKRTRLTLTTTPKATEHGATAEATIEGLPGRVRVFGDDRLLDHDRGTVLDAYAGISASERPALSGVVASVRGTVDVVKHPDDHIARVRDGLRDAAAALPTGPDRLVPAMTLGDERGFGAGDQEMMVDSGLAHLTAVSGANVSLLVGAAVWAFAWAPPRWRVVVAAVTLAAFVAVVGTEPSVLRALMTGIVGLLAVLLGRRGQALPALMAGTIVLIVAFPDLAVSIGFALSVAATAGLVLAAAPMTHRLLRIPGVARMPAPLVRAAAVALVAHVATVPVLALTLGEVSHVSVLANLAAAPAVAPVTILGTLAAVAALLGLGPVVAVLVHAAAPFAWWVWAVGHAAAGLPGASGEMGMLGLAVFVALAYIFTDLIGDCFRYSQTFKGSLTEQQTRLEGFAQFIFHTLPTQLQRVFTVIGTNKQAHIGIFRLNHINDAVGDFLLMRADGDDFRFANPCRFQHVLAGAIAKINTEAEFSSSTHAVG